MWSEINIQQFPFCSPINPKRKNVFFNQVQDCFKPNPKGKRLPRQMFLTVKKTTTKHKQNPTTSPHTNNHKHKQHTREENHESDVTQCCWQFLLSFLGINCFSQVKITIWAVVLSNISLSTWHKTSWFIRYVFEAPCFSRRIKITSVVSS